MTTLAEFAALEESQTVNDLKHRVDALEVTVAKLVADGGKSKGNRPRASKATKQKLQIKPRE